MRFLLIAYSAGVLLVGVVPALVDWRVMALLLGLLCALAGGVLWGRGVKLTAGAGAGGAGDAGDA